MILYKDIVLRPLPWVTGMANLKLAKLPDRMPVKIKIMVNPELIALFKLAQQSIASLSPS